MKIDQKFADKIEPWVKGLTVCAERQIDDHTAIVVAYEVDDKPLPSLRFTMARAFTIGQSVEVSVDVQNGAAFAVIDRLLEHYSV